MAHHPNPALTIPSLTRSQTYRYKVFNKAQRKFIVNKQEFSRFARDYPWNPVDNVICGASDVTLTEEMRYRRVLFAIIPQYQSSAEPGSDLKAMADEYTENFKKLIDYLSNRSGDGDKIEIKYRNDEDTENQTEPASQEKIQRGLQWERETNKVRSSGGERGSIPGCGFDDDI